MGEALLVRKGLGPLAAVNPSTCPHVGVRVSPHSLGESPFPPPTPGSFIKSTQSSWPPTESIAWIRECQLPGPSGLTLGGRRPESEGLTTESAWIQLLQNQFL